MKTIFIFLVFTAFVAALQFRPIHDTDIFWQRKLGALALEQGRIVTHEPFTSTHAGERIIPICWLSQIIEALLYSWGGWELLRQVDALFFAGAFLWIGLSLRSRAGGAGIAVGMALGFMAAIPHASLRPQSFAVFSFALFLSLARPPWSWKKMILLALVLVLWQNFHPSVVLAVGVLGIRFLWALFQRDRLEAQCSLLMLAMATAAVVATPCGFDLFGVSADNARISQELGVAEWLPLWTPANWPASASAWAALLIVGYLLIREYPKGAGIDVCVLLGMTILLLSAARFAIFWGIAAVPVVAQVLGKGGMTFQPPATGNWRFGLGWVAAALAIISAIAIPRLITPKLFSDTIPLGGIAQIKAQNLSGVIYTYAQWGGPVVDATWPNCRVTHDGRYYLFSPAEWQSYREEAEGLVALPEIAARYHPDAFFLHPRGQAGLIALLRGCEGWRELTPDGLSVIFVPAKAQSH